MLVFGPGLRGGCNLNKAEVKGCWGGQLLLPLKPSLAPAGPGCRGRPGSGRAACVWKSLPSTCTGTGEGETKVPNELVKHLYNFSSFYKEGLLYTIYTWR